MNVIDKKDIDETLKFLQATAEREENYQLRGALINMSCVLKQAIERHREDSQHPHLYLEIRKAPNYLDSVIDECYTTDCVHYRKDNCPFAIDRKYQCPRIADCLEVDYD